MNPSNKDGWHPPPGAPQSHAPVDQLGQQQSRPLGSYGSVLIDGFGVVSRTPPCPSSRVATPSSSRTVLQASTKRPYHPASQQSGHTLPTLADITQSQPPHQQPPRYGQQQQPLEPGHTLPGIAQTMQHSPPQSSLGRERERESRDRDRELLDRRRDMPMQRDEEMMRREREMRDRDRDREQAERYHREQPQQHQQQQQQQQHHPVQSHAGSIPIHQPVASKVPNSIHGPNGLLSNLSANAAPNTPQGGSNLHQGSNASGSLFGGQVQHADGPPRQYAPQAQSQGSQVAQGGAQGPPSQSLLNFAGSAPGQVPGSVATLSQGQQPILNDALSYLDQVKVRFVEQPDVYNRFLDIMKDFKSQAIDTPGVIQRVSTLFNGHPALIQGFNTFLPAGYRIECGTEDNPDAIRVTTPSGTNTISMQASGRASFEPVGPSSQPSGPPHAARTDYYEESRPGWQQPQAHNQQQPQQAAMVGSGTPYSPKGRVMQTPIYGQQGGGQGHQQEGYDYHSQHDQQSAALAHQQEQQQRGVSQLQSAASATAGAAGRSTMRSEPQMQTPGAAQSIGSLAGLGMQASQGDASKRGPVEFNHAISYVNKIKNRFADTPDIYKQFLEILQTYQRESKPIQDVYSQVTLLFSGAPDLLEDFKQFLPESAAQAKAQAAAANRQAQDEVPPTSNMRGEPPYGSTGASGQGQPARSDVKMPPLGQFNVKDSTKEGKKRRGGPAAQGPVAGAPGPAIAEPAPGTAGSQANRAQAPQTGANKRTKLTHKPAPPEVPVAATSPTLVPALPEPMPPSYSATPSSEEYAFFDRVKKYIGNKQNFAEFLKLCNLYSADLIDRNILINRATGFIGANQEIMTWFKRFIHADGKDELIEPKPKVESDLVNLSHCRSLGPSYRLLPKRERQKPCSGRDELCQSVLNDEWASHPTWASEDSGFVAHRKNTYEDAMHRIEEDRHDYDHHIEATIRTIQLMEPLVHQLAVMNEADRANFKLPPGLGGQSEAIYKRVIKKVYDRENGEKIVGQLFDNPSVVLPIVFSRMQQKCEEWKAVQREWDKVWREMMQRGFWRSLDHQALTNKAHDKKIFVSKHIHHEVQAKREEFRSLHSNGYLSANYQLEFVFEDAEVVLDTARLLLCYVDNNGSTFGPEPGKTLMFIKDFIPAFFGLDSDSAKAYLSEAYESGPPTDEGEEDESVPDDAVSSRSRRGANSKKLGLLRDVLERQQGEKSAQQDRDTSEMSMSRGSSPGYDSLPEASPASETNGSAKMANLRWMEHPNQGNFNQEREYPLNEPYKKNVQQIYCNLTIYSFIRTFEVLYTRLLRLKQHEKEAQEALRRARAGKPAYDLGMVDKPATDLFYDSSPDANLYQQIVRMCEDVIKGEIEMPHLEETLRRFYLDHGWRLYTLEKILFGICRFAAAIYSADPKDKSADIVAMFFKEREKEETTHNQELQYRKQVEKLVKEGDVYRVSFNPETKHEFVQLMTSEESTFINEEMSPEARWSYYVSSFIMRDPTEGVPYSEMRMPFLKRNLPPKLESDDEGYDIYYRPFVSDEQLVIRICANSYHILYEPGTRDVWYRKRPTAEGQAEIERASASVKEKRRDRFMEKFVNNPRWTHGMSKDDVDESNQKFRSWVGEIESASRRRSSRSEKATTTTTTSSGPAVSAVKTEEGEKEDTVMDDVPQDGDA